MKGLQGAAKMAKINKGKMACETCGNVVTVKENENNTLSYRCDECDAAPYAKLGTLQHVHWTKKIGANAAAPTEPQKPAIAHEKKPAADNSNLWGL